MGEQLEDIVVVRKSTSGCADAEVPARRKKHVLRPEAHFIIVGVVRYAVVDQDRENVFVVLNLRSYLHGKKPAHQDQVRQHSAPFCKKQIRTV